MFLSTELIQLVQLGHSAGQNEWMDAGWVDKLRPSPLKDHAPFGSQITKNKLEDCANSRATIVHTLLSFSCL